jgi:DNA-binding MarR family transcriptional regulator
MQATRAISPSRLIRISAANGIASSWHESVFPSETLEALRAAGRVSARRPSRERRVVGSWPAPTTCGWLAIDVRLAKRQVPTTTSGTTVWQWPRIHGRVSVLTSGTRTRPGDMTAPTTQARPPMGSGHPDRQAAAESATVPKSPGEMLLVMRQIARAVLAIVADGARFAGLNQNAYIALLRIVAGDEITAADLKRILGLSGGSATEVADRLEQHGLIFRKRRPGRRRVLLRPTAKGRRMAERTIGPVIAELGDAVSGLNGEELAAVGSFLRNVARALGDAPVDSVRRP